jgi:predicted nucleic-acid-binding protein
VIALDTNVLLRLFVRDHPERARAVTKLLADAGPASVRVSTIVLAELVWTLQRRYRLEKGSLIATLQNLLTRSELELEGRGAVMTAIRWYELGDADFVDYLIAALNRDAGAAPTFTFDRVAGSHSAFSLLS